METAGDLVSRERFTIWLTFLLSLIFVRALYLICSIARPRESEWVEVYDHGEQVDDLSIPTADSKGTVSYDAEIRRVG